MLGSITLLLRFRKVGRLRLRLLMKKLRTDLFAVIDLNVISARSRVLLEDLASVRD